MKIDYDLLSTLSIALYMNNFDKLKVIAYACQLQIIEIFDCIKNMCYAERVRLTEEVLERHKQAQSIDTPRKRIC